MIPNAFHATRGMLEFWVDPESPYYKEIFGSGKEFIFYCKSGWRSSLATATLQDMGLSPVRHIERRDSKPGKMLDCPPVQKTGTKPEIRISGSGLPCIGAWQSRNGALTAANVTCPSVRLW